MTKRTVLMSVGLATVMASAGVVSAKNWRDGLKAGQCTAHVHTSGSTCEVSFRGNECHAPAITGTPAPGGVCVTADGRWRTGDDPALAKKHEEKK